ncbi:RNA polymerase sigma factor [Anatilimnocola floriformis]|uniref:RNA polymerase sigma factor n=1 Tax=Anatilimnocola floriformis TaxID=2948575 RepID=UPI0020C5200D|nr:sigma-70 family RNA polymerase sigma factor [Anatilimnocola floriformis]
MDSAVTVELQQLLDRLRAGDQQARREFLEQACGRLRRLAGKILSGSFPNLQRRHDVDSVVHETWLRLIQAMDKADPPTVADFFRLAAHKIRQVLLDMVADRQRTFHQHETMFPANDSLASRMEPGDQSLDGARLAIWTEFHNKVGTLADAERTIFEMHYYLGLPQAEIAKILELHPRKVSYLWVAATEYLAADLTQIARL